MRITRCESKLDILKFIVDVEKYTIVENIVEGYWVMRNTNLKKKENTFCCV